MKFKKIMKSVFCFGMVGVMVLGSTTPSIASEVVTSVESTELVTDEDEITEAITETVEVIDAVSEVIESTEVVTTDAVIEEINTVEKEATDVIVAMPFGDEIAEDVTVIIEERLKADEIIENAESIIDAAEEQIEEEGLLEDTTSNITDANTELDKADEALNGTTEETESAIDALDRVIAETEAQYGDVSSMEFESIEEAGAVLETVGTAKEEAQAAYDTAAEALLNAESNLAAAQEAYEAAKAISDEAAEQAAAELEKAQVELAEAQAVAEAVNNRVDKLQTILDKASAAITEKKEDIGTTIENVEEKLEESRENLEAALENVQSENAEFNEAVTDFGEKYDAFVESAKNFYDSIENAQDKQAALEELYAEYEALQQAYADAQAALEAEENRTGVTFEEYEALMSELESAMNTAESEKNALESEKNALEADKNVALEDLNKYKTEDALEYLDNLNSYRDVLSSTEATQEEKDTAAKNAAQLVIEKELAAGQTVQWIKAGESEYGKSETGFYVVLDAEGKLVERYGYKLVTDENGNGSVNIYRMKSDSVVNYVEYNGVNYAIDAETMTIKVPNGDGEITLEVAVELDGGEHYYIKDNVTSQYVDDTSKNPVSVDLSAVDLGEVLNSILKKVMEEGYAIEIVTEGEACYIDLGLTKLELVNENGKYWYVTEEPDEKTLICNGTSWKHWFHTDSCYEIASYKYVYTEIPVNYEQKAQVAYGDSFYDVMTTESGKHYINVDGKMITVYVDEVDGNTTYRVKKDVAYTAGGTADTIFDFGDATDKNSNTYVDAMQNAQSAYDEKTLAYNNKVTEFNDKVTEYNNKVDEYNTKNEAFKELDELHTDMINKEEAAEEKDLGTLANLPKDFSELVEALKVDSVEDVETILGVIAVIIDDNATQIDKVEAYAELAEFLPIGSLELDENVDFDSMSRWEKAMFIANILPTDLGEALLNPESFKHEYLMAWIDAVDAKLQVVSAGMEVVDATNATITSGLNVIVQGENLADARIDAALAQIETAILEGAVDALVVAGNLLEVSEQIVSAMNDKVAVLEQETKEAYDAVCDAQEALENLVLDNAKSEELKAAEDALKAANERYNTLVGELADASVSLEAAEDYYDVARTEYERLVAEKNEEIPTPEVTPEETPDAPEIPEETPDAPEVTPEETPNAPEITPEETPEVTPEETPEVTPEETPNAPEITPEETPEVTPEETPNAVTTPDNYYVGNESTIVEVADEVAEMLTERTSRTRRATVEVEDEEVLVEIIDEEVPLAVEEELVEIIDEEVPLAVETESQNTMTVGAVVAATVAVVSIGGFGYYLFFVRKKTLQSLLAKLFTK